MFSPKGLSVTADKTSSAYEHDNCRRKRMKIVVKKAAPGSLILDALSPVREAREYAK